MTSSALRGRSCIRCHDTTRSMLGESAAAEAEAEAAGSACNSRHKLRSQISADYCKVPHRRPGRASRGNFPHRRSKQDVLVTEETAAVSAAGCGFEGGGGGDDDDDDGTGI
eukprot:2461170-Pleurochrysis_carterae.AAC.1